ncbi:sporulation protein [Bacillus coahuilensis m2-6]|uniref:Sporulation protein n=1 Tax=Bacillus coahuilensis p1.1.43 TaxID=1150625 RepID=A0A147K6W7_9BACI|nr:sporulation membrane protein YtrI [Bacillus coahuilensis]KUP05590.1 sporulation protein [Bacillus coahuilensis p1.1.43]KUP06664.1 sporulation protein [Bacillus coahuilensis m2-6]
MRIPPYYRIPSWQRFFVGCVLGGIVSWMIFLFIFGSLQEKLSMDILELKSELEEVERQKDIYFEDAKELNEKNERLLTIQTVEVKIANAKKYDLQDSYTIKQAEELLVKELNLVINKDLETIFTNKELIIKLLENKVMKINKKNYTFQVKEMYFFTSLQIVLEMKLA